MKESRKIRSQKFR